MRYCHLETRVAEGVPNKVVTLITCDCCYATLSEEDKAHRKTWYGKTRDKRIDLCLECADMLIPADAYRNL